MSERKEDPAVIDDADPATRGDIRAIKLELRRVADIILMQQSSDAVNLINELRRATRAIRRSGLISPI